MMFQRERGKKAGRRKETGRKKNQNKAKRPAIRETKEGGSETQERRGLGSLIHGVRVGLTWRKEPIYKGSGQEKRRE